MNQAQLFHAKMIIVEKSLQTVDELDTLRTIGVHQHLGTETSIDHVFPLSGGNYWATSFIWARNHKTIERRDTDAIVAEAVAANRAQEHPYWTIRVESEERTV